MVGGVVGLAVVIALAALLAWYLRRKRSSAAPTAAEPTDTTEFPTGYDDYDPSGGGSNNVVHRPVFYDAPVAAPEQSAPASGMQELLATGTVPGAGTAAAAPANTSPPWPAAPAPAPRGTPPVSAPNEPAKTNTPRDISSGRLQNAADEAGLQRQTSTRPTRQAPVAAPATDSQRTPKQTTNRPRVSPAYAATPTQGVQRTSGGATTHATEFYEPNNQMLSATYEDAWASSDSPYGRAGVGRVMEEDPPPPRAFHMQPGQVYTHASPLGAFTHG